MKHALTSFTVWFGILQIALAALGYLSNQMGPTEAWTLLTTGLGTIGFRFKTSEPIVIR